MQHLFDFYCLLNLTADGFLRLSSAVHDAQLYGYGLRVKPINALHSEWN